MPSMYEIYDKYSSEYDELISHEDYKKNLFNFLAKEFINIETVLEIGVGTGRVTELYIDNVKKATCTDFAQHMIDKAKINLNQYLHKIDFLHLDTRSIEKLDLNVDCIIEGWAIGHSAIDEYNRLEDFASKLFHSFNNLLNGNGKIILIETMGTNVSQPTIPVKELEDFYSLIETKYNLKRHILQTDYKFESIDEAKRIMGFFFGNEITKTITSNIIPEFTGVWVGSKF